MDQAETVTEHGKLDPSEALLRKALDALAPFERAATGIIPAEMPDTFVFSGVTASAWRQAAAVASELRGRPASPAAEVRIRFDTKEQARRFATVPEFRELVIVEALTPLRKALRDTPVPPEPGC